MNRSDVAADILDGIAECLGPERCRDYQMLRSRGVPPADCNSIATSWTDKTTDLFSDCAPKSAPCEPRRVSHGMRLTITSICIGPDGEPTFDMDKEDAAAECFDNDVDTIERCIECGDWSTLYAEHFLESLTYEATSYDVEAEGGAYSATITLRIVATECCPEDAGT